MSEEAALSISLPVQRETAVCSPKEGFNWPDPEFLSVAATLLFMLLGGFGTLLGLPRRWAPWFFLAAYLTGGWHGTIKGVRSLLARHGRRRSAHDPRRARRGLRQPRLRGRDAPLPLFALEHAAGNGHRAEPLRHFRADEIASRNRALQTGRGNASSSASRSSSSATSSSSGPAKAFRSTASSIEGTST